MEALATHGFVATARSLHGGTTDVTFVKKRA